ncbi:hypothetical protein UPYG_G00345510 [Umbra pygmaea]|uniref:Uncharacterized protein n=1 Tax=Umbra pygmaea TaxID=75934 RepID=A0ABD0VXS6_UMBPY
MNWVGGSRNRFMMRNDVKKQREFFEKKKIQRRIKTLGIATCPEEASGGSMDLVTLFIVNQIAAKKHSIDQPKMTRITHDRGPKTIRQRPLELPMSPCSPSQLSLVESQPFYSVQPARKRKPCIPDEFKGRRLSPVLESNMSDTSGLDYQHPIRDTLSPFSSGSSSVFSLQQRVPVQPHRSPIPWDDSALEHTQFRPLCQPVERRECAPGFNVSQHPLSPPPVCTALFGTEPDIPETRDPPTNTAGFSIHPLKGKLHPFEFPFREQKVDFSLSQSDRKVPNEEPFFRGFRHEEKGSEAPHFKKSMPKIYLKQELLTTSSRDVSNFTDVSSSCPGHVHLDSMECFQSSSSYSPRGDHHEEDVYPQPYQAGSTQFHTDRCHSAESPILSCASSSWKNTQHVRPYTPDRSPQCKGNCGNHQRAIYSSGCSESPSVCLNTEDYDSQAKAMGDQYVPSRPLSESQSSEDKTAAVKTRVTETVEMATQTVSDVTSKCPTADASTQCSFRPVCEANVLRDYESINTTVCNVILTPSTRGQSIHRDASVTLQTHRASPDTSGSAGIKNTPNTESTARKLKVGPGHHPSVIPLKQACQSSPESRLHLKRLTMSASDTLLNTNDVQDLRGLQQ